MKKKTLLFAGLLLVAGSMVACYAQDADFTEDDLIAMAEENKQTSSEDVDESLNEETELITSDISNGLIANEDFSLHFDVDKFDVDDDYENGYTVSMSYCEEGVNEAGANVINITKVEDTTPEEVLIEVAESNGESADKVTDTVYGVQQIPAKAYFNCASSDTLTVYDSYIAFTKGEYVIVIEQFRTIGTEEETEMLIDGSMVSVLDSIELTE